MNLQSVRAAAKESMKSHCRLCALCDGRACAGQVPGMGGAITGSSFTANSTALANVKLNMRIVHAVDDPDTSFDFFGQKLKTPIMAAPMVGAVGNCGFPDENSLVAPVIGGAHAAGSMGWIGDPCDANLYALGLAAIRKAGRGVAIIKPRQDLLEIHARFDEAIEAGATMLGMDLDGAGLVTLRLKGVPVGPKTIEQLRSLRNHAPELPFIIKGIMTVDDALRCAEAGVSCIVVSNHGGRVLDGVPGVAQVLPDIARQVGDRMTIIADGCVRSGVDVLKYLALGADGVLVGRPLCWGAVSGEDGVKCVIDTYTNQLYQAMIMTGCADIKSVHGGILF